MRQDVEAGKIQSTLEECDQAPQLEHDPARFQTVPTNDTSEGEIYEREDDYSNRILALKV